MWVGVPNTPVVQTFCLRRGATKKKVRLKGRGAKKELFQREDELREGGSHQNQVYIRFILNCESCSATPESKNNSKSERSKFKILLDCACDCFFKRKSIAAQDVWWGSPVYL